MAPKRSDFAQKLLDDLRLRKEKLGYITSSAQPPSAEYHGNSQRSFRGTGEAMKNYSRRNLVSTEVTEVRFSTKHNKTAAPEAASLEIVPVRRATSVQNSVDVSMALALALSNSGKLHYIAKFGNGFIPHSGSIYYSEGGNQQLLYSTKYHAHQYPFLSNLQISEISKGVQKLNKILETCSNRSNFGRDSIQIGRELLKGAMDLEESLKMLVTLQEASDYMVGSQGRQVRLLKDKEEDESSNNKVNQKTLMYKPRTSFDGSTNHFYHLAKANDDTIIQGHRKSSSKFISKSMTETNCNESSLDASMQFATHRRSLSCGPGSVPNSFSSGVTRKHDQGDEFGKYSISNGKSSTSKNIRQLDPKSHVSGNVRMSNIVAKLMGLEEIPTPKADVKRVEGKKELKSKKEMSIGQALVADAKVRKEVISSQRHFTQNYEEKKTLNEKHIEENKAKSSKEKTNYTQNMTPTSNHAPNSHLEINRKIENIDMTHSLKEGIARNNLVQLREKAEKKEQRSKRSESVPQDIKKSNLESELQRTKKKYSRRHDEMAGKKDTLLNQKDDEQVRLGLPSNQTNTQVSQQKSTIDIITPNYAVHEIAKEKVHDVNSKLKVTTATKGDQKSRKSTDKRSMHKVLSGGTVVATERSPGKDENIEQPKEHTKSSQQEMQIIMNRKSDYMELDRTSYDNSDAMKSLQTYPKTDKEKPVPQILVTALMKPVQIPTAKMVDTANMKVHRGESHKVIGDSPAYIKTPNKKSQQSSFLIDLEKRWRERTSKDTGATVSSCETNPEQHPEQETKSTLLSDNSSVDAGRDKEVIEERSVRETNGDDKNKTAFQASQEQEVSLSANSQPQLVNLEENQTEDAIDDRQLNNCNLLKWQNQAIFEGNGQGSLTKDEHLLKQILINNQHFLNTAQTLFKIEIPVGVPQTSNQTCPKEEKKNLLDCGYELLRRKGKREVANAMIRPYTARNVRYLDALVKELNDDIESLKFPNETTLDDDTAEFLHMMLERDIENRKPDTNCMWDIGWSSIIFASVEKDEIIRDLEKHVLNGLISELARELVNATITVS